MKLICSLISTCLRFSSRIKSWWEILKNMFIETVLFIFPGLICSSWSMHYISYKMVPISLSLYFSLIFLLCLLLYLVHTKGFSFYISSGFHVIFSWCQRCHYVEIIILIKKQHVGRSLHDFPRDCLSFWRFSQLVVQIFCQLFIRPLVSATKCRFGHMSVRSNIR